MRRQLATIAISALGVGVFYLLGLPLPFLFGALAASLVAALAGVRLQSLGLLSQGARMVLGVAIGAAVTPALIGQVPNMLASLAIVPIYIALIGIVGVPFFRRVCGFDPVTSYYAAMPGGAADMITFGQEAGANVRQLSLIHVTRMLVIMVIAPLVLVYIYGVSLDNPVGAPASDIALSQMALMAVAGVIGWQGGKYLGLFGAVIMGPLIVSALLSLAGLLTHRPPQEALWAAQFLIGTGIGVSYVGVTWGELRRIVLATAAFVLILAVLAALVTEVVYLTGLAPPVEGFLAFTPGGQAEMTLLALIAGADMSFVILHHLARILIVIFGAPIVFRLIKGKR